MTSNFSYHSYKHQDGKSSIGSSSLGLDSQPLVEVHNGYATRVLGGGRNTKKATKAINSASLQQIQLDNPGKEIGGFQGNGNCPYGESPNAEVSVDSGSSEELRRPNLLRGGCGRDFEVYDGLETRMEELQEPTEEDRMEDDGISHNES